MRRGAAAPLPARRLLAGAIGLALPVVAAAAQQAERPLTVDIHSHPSRFHRANVARIADDGIARYLDRANPETTRDTLDLSEHPVVFSHAGAFALGEHDRHLLDPEIHEIAARGGVIGGWPNGSLVPTVADMALHIASVGGAGSLGIGSDLRGMSSYSEGFGNEANFEAVAEAMAEAGFDGGEVRGILGANFERVWSVVTAHLAEE